MAITTQPKLGEKTGQGESAWGVGKKKNEMGPRQNKSTKGEGFGKKESETSNGLGGF